MILLHGTTRLRATLIVRDGPDPCYPETGGEAVEDGFSMNLDSGPFLFGTPEQYARGKSKEFPNEGGPVILEVDVPDAIVAKAISDWFPLNQGLVQFDKGGGLEELIRAWPTLSKQIRSVP